MVVNGTVVGPFEEEEEGTGIASDVVKVKGEDPATPGLLLQGIDPGTVTIPQYRYNKTKQHTHHWCQKKREPIATVNSVKSIVESS